MRISAYGVRRCPQDQEAKAEAKARAVAQPALIRNLIDRPKSAPANPVEVHTVSRPVRSGIRETGNHPETRRWAARMYHEPIPSPITARRARAMGPLYAQLHRMFTVGTTFPQVRRPDNSLVYTLDAPFSHGTFANVRLGLTPDGRGCAVRELFLEGGATERKGLGEKELANELRILHILNSPLFPFHTCVVNWRILEASKLYAGNLQGLGEHMRKHCITPTEEEREGFDYTVAYTLAATLALHEERRVLHLDIKPDNILWGADGSFTMADYGLAHEGRAVSVLNYAGTWAYMAPEWFNGTTTHVTGKADIYSAGLTLCVLLGGSQKQLPGYGRSPSIAAGMLRDWRSACTADKSIDGPLDWSKVRKRRGLGNVARAVYDNRQDLATYIFDHMLLVNPNRRASGKQFLAFMTPRFRPAHADAAARLCARLAAADTDRSEKIASMAAYQARRP